MVPSGTTLNVIQTKSLPNILQNVRGEKKKGERERNEWVHVNCIYIKQGVAIGCVSVTCVAINMRGFGKCAVGAENVWCAHYGDNSWSESSRRKKEEACKDIWSGLEKCSVLTRQTQGQEWIMAKWRNVEIKKFKKRRSELTNPSSSSVCFSDEPWQLITQSNTHAQTHPEWHK